MNSTSRSTRWALLALLCLLTIAGNARAAFLGAAATMDQLATPGMSIGVDGYTFTDFKLTPSAAANNKIIPPTNFSVTAVSIPGNKVELKFQFPGVWKELDFSEMILEFNAVAPQGYAFNYHGLSFGPSFFGDASGDPYATIAEMVVPTDPNSTQAPYTLGVYADPGFSKLMDGKDIVTPSATLKISKDIQISGGTSEETTRAVLTDFTQTFMTMPIVPEPTSVGLAGIAVAAAGVFLRRR